MFQVWFSLFLNKDISSKQNLSWKVLDGFISLKLTKLWNLLRQFPWQHESSRKEKGRTRSRKGFPSLHQQNLSSSPHWLSVSCQSALWLHWEGTQRKGMGMPLILSNILTDSKAEPGITKKENCRALRPGNYTHFFYESIPCRGFLVWLYIWLAKAAVLFDFVCFSLALIHSTEMCIGTPDSLG